MSINWLKYRKNLRGRDPLGVQAINIHLYGVLVPGITNVTQRLRYYSFYPWLLKSYKEENIRLDFIPYLRRAEFLFNVITNYHHREDRDRSRHMVGERMIGHSFDDLDESGKIVISKYATMKESQFRYFKNRLGGFGQYYLAVMASMGILDIKGNSDFVLYPRGIDLAESFDSGNSREKFLSCVINDTATVKDLDVLKKDFCACNLNESGKEYKLLAEYLKEIDDPFVQNPTYKRRNTLAVLYLLLRQSAKTSNFWELLDFLFYGFSADNKKLTLPAALKETADLWKYYVKHEYFSMALLAIFISIQNLLAERSLTRDEICRLIWEKYFIDCDVSNLNRTLRKCLVELKRDPTLSGFLNYLDANYKADKAWEMDALSKYSLGSFLLNRQGFSDALCVGGVVLLCLVLRSIIRDESNHVPSVLRSILFQYPINLRKLQSDYVERWRDFRVSSVISDISIEYITSRHNEVGIRKLYTEGLATFRILKDGNKYTRSEIAIDYVARTNPRLQQCLQMLADLKIIEETREGFGISKKNTGTQYFKDVLGGN
jgi:hypothetical protein